MQHFGVYKPDAVAEALLRAGQMTIQIGGGATGFLGVTVGLPEDAYVSGTAVTWCEVAMIANRAVREVVMDYMRDVAEVGQRPYQLVLDAARYFHIPEENDAAVSQLLQWALDVATPSQPRQVAAA